jgi:hypothetical protein
MNTAEKVIYEDGATYLQTHIYRDAQGIERCAYSGHLSDHAEDLTVEDYLARRPGLVCLSFDEAMERITKAEEETYIKPWSEITEEEWTDALEVLPPQGRRTVEGVEIFRMSEYTTNDITLYYAACHERYFCAHRRIWEPYSKIAGEIKQL